MESVADSSVTYFARTNFRNQHKLFGVRDVDRHSHVYIIGKTGTGKSTLLRTFVEQDIRRGRGLALFDPHGDLIDSVLPAVPEGRAADLVHLDPLSGAEGWTFNPFADIAVEQRSLAAAGIVEVFKKIWPDDWGPRLEHLLRNVVFTLLETPGASLGDVPRLITDKDYRRDLAAVLENEEVRAFWQTEYERYSPAFRAVIVAPLQNKLGALLTDPVLRRVLCAEKSSLDLVDVLNSGRVLLVSLPKGRMGEGPASLLGSLLVSHIALAALARADRPEARRRSFIAYIDEFQTFTTHSLVTMLAELRKYRVGMVLAHQYLGQLDREIRDAVLGNAGTLISFRIGAQDAPLIARELAPKFKPEDLISLPNYSIYLRLLIDGEPSKPFSAVTMPKIDALRLMPGRGPRARKGGSLRRSKDCPRHR